MGLKSGSTNKTWLSIREGQIAKREGESITLFGSIEGYLRGLSTRDGKFGVELHVLLEDDGELFDLTIPVKDHPSPGKNPTQSSYFRAFSHLAPNIDVSKKVEIIPSLKVVDNKKNSTLFISQEDQSLKWAFKKGDGIMPEAEEVKNSKGEVLTLDWSAVETFRMDKVNELNARIAEYRNMSETEKFLGSEPADNTAWKKVYEQPANTFAEPESQDGPNDMPF